MNRKAIFAAVGAFALLGIGLSALAVTAAPASHATSADLPVVDDAAEASEPAESDLEDGGLESDHEFEGEEEGEF